MGVPRECYHEIIMVLDRRSSYPVLQSHLVTWNSQVLCQSWRDPNLLEIMLLAHKFSVRGHHLVLLDHRFIFGRLGGKGLECIHRSLCGKSTENTRLELRGDMGTDVGILDQNYIEDWVSGDNLWAANGPCGELTVFMSNDATL